MIAVDVALEQTSTYIWSRPKPLTPAHTRVWDKVMAQIAANDRTLYTSLGTRNSNQAIQTHPFCLDRSSGRLYGDPHTQLIEHAPVSGGEKERGEE